MFRKLIATPNDWGMFVVRVALAAVIFPHGAQKLLGWFGGPGLSNSIQFFSGTWGIHPVLTTLVVLAESLGAVALALGLVGRFQAFGIAAAMAGAIYYVTGANGFFMNWFGNQAGEGFEFHVLTIAMALAVMVRGSGALSLDRVLQRKLETLPASEMDEPGAVPATA
jgi:putative oxidoreductase